MATLPQMIRMCRWDPSHDYREHKEVGGEIVALYGLGLYEEDLEAARKDLPTHDFKEVRRVEHEHATWLRVDVVPKEAK